jgi:hypothetical protein
LPLLVNATGPVPFSVVCTPSFPPMLSEASVSVVAKTAKLLLRAVPRLMIIGPTVGITVLVVVAVTVLVAVLVTVLVTVFATVGGGVTVPVDVFATVETTVEVAVKTTVDVGVAVAALDEVGVLEEPHPAIKAIGINASTVK